MVVRIVLSRFVTCSRLFVYQSKKHLADKSFVCKNGVIKVYDPNYGGQVEDAKKVSIKFTFKNQEVDKSIWILSRKVKFSVLSFYNTIANQESNCFPWRKIWKSRPFKGDIFVDSLIGEDLDNGQPTKRQLIVIGWCFMWKKSATMVSPLLFYCEVARAFWDDLFNKVGIA